MTIPNSVIIERVKRNFDGVLSAEAKEMLVQHIDESFYKEVDELMYKINKVHELTDKKTLSKDVVLYVLGEL